MASKVSGYIGKINPNNGTTQYSLGSTAYGYCETAAATAAKTVDMTGFTLIEGATIFIKFKYNNTATDDPTLNVQGTGAKPLIPKTWQSGAILSLTFDGTSWVEATTYSLNTAVNAGTTSQIAYYSTNNTISGVGDTASPIYGLRYYHTNSSAHTPAALSRLHVYGVTYGNTADNMISNTAGLFSYGDGGPQITFSYSADGGQAGALIYTDNDAAGAGASWNFVTTESDWNVTSKRFHARTGISVGTNLPPRTTTPYPTDDYNLYVNGTSRFALGTSDNTSNKKFIIGSSGERYLSFGGAGVQAYDTSDAISTLHLNYSGGPIYIGNGVSASSTSSELRIKGRVVVDPYYHSTNSFSEFRINRASNGWSGITLGGAKDSLSATGLGIWLVGAKSGTDATTAAANITDSQFYIAYNGSNSAACRIQGHNATGFSIRPRLAVNADVNTDYTFYVSGTAAISNTLYLTRATDAAGTADNKPALMIGNSTGQHIEIDGNEILSKSDATTPGTLYLQDGTGSVNVSGSGGLTITSLTASQAVSTDANKKLVSTNLSVSDPSASGSGITYIATISQSATGKITATKSTVRDASTSQSGIVSTGTQQFKGRKGFGYLNLYAEDAGTAKRYIDIIGYNNAGTQVAEIYYDAGNATNITTGIWRFKEFSPQSTADTTTTGFYEWYSLPVVNKGLTANQGYNILTSKNAVKIEEGGTGATTAAAARANLGALGAINANNYDGMATMAGATNTYIRTTQSGIIPYQSGGAGSGHCNIGTSSWRFANVYTDKINGLAPPQMEIISYTGNDTLSMSITFSFAPDIIIALDSSTLDNTTGIADVTAGPQICDMSKVTTSWQGVHFGVQSIGVSFYRSTAAAVVVCSKSSNGKTYYLKVDTTLVNTLPQAMKDTWGAGTTLRIGEKAVYNYSGVVTRFLGIKI